MLRDFLTNKIMLSVFFSYLIASSLKVLINLYKTKKLSLKFFFRTGGMPSSHAATSSAMVTSIYILEGLSNLFFVSLVIGAVIVSDAVGIRRAAGKQAEILNRIMAEFPKKGFKAERLYELLGHTPIQVVIGILIGISVTIAVFRVI